MPKVCLLLNQKRGRRFNKTRFFSLAIRTYTKYGAVLFLTYSSWSAWTSPDPSSRGSRNNVQICPYQRYQMRIHQRTSLHSKMRWNLLTSFSHSSVSAHELSNLLVHHHLCLFSSLVISPSGLPSPLSCFPITIIFGPFIHDAVAFLCIVDSMELSQMVGENCYLLPQEIKAGVEVSARLLPHAAC